MSAACFVNNRQMSAAWFVKKTTNVRYMVCKKRQMSGTWFVKKRQMFAAWFVKK